MEPATDFLCSFNRADTARRACQDLPNGGLPCVPPRVQASVQESKLPYEIAWIRSFGERFDSLRLPRQELVNGSLCPGVNAGRKIVLIKDHISSRHQLRIEGL